MTDHYNQQQLTDSNHNVQVPFAINLAKDKGILTCNAILRLLAKKRISCFAQWQNQPVFAKLFFDNKRQHQHFQREVHGANALAQANILTPKLLFSGKSHCGSIHIVIYEKIFDAVNVTTAIEINSPKLLDQFLETIAKHHLAGVLQNDIHLDNFLVAKNKIYSIDCADIKVPKKSRIKSLSRRASLKNLGTLYAQFRQLPQQKITESFASYTYIRGWKLKPSLWQQLDKEIKNSRKLRQHKYLKKIFRDCSEFITKRSQTYFFVSRRDCYSPEISALISNPDAFLNNARILKAGRSSTVGLVAIDNRQIVIKRYNIKNYRHAISRCWRPSRAWHSWRNAHHLQMIGITTPKPIAMIERRFGPLRSSAYFITEYINGTTLADFVATNNMAKFQELIPLIYQIFNKLGHDQLSHGDMKATNFIVTDDTLALLDLDALTQHRFHWRYNSARKCDKNRFLNNFCKQDDIFQQLKYHLNY